MGTNTSTAMRVWLCLALTIVHLATGRAQCPTSATVINSQSGLVAFAQAYSQCDTLKQNLTISGNAITDLSPLSFLRVVTGVLTISQTSLTSLTGLHNIDSIKSLVVTQNPILEHLTGLEGLRVVGDAFRLEQNAALQDLTGLQSLIGVNGLFSVKQNVALINFSGLENVYGIADFEVMQNQSLMTLEGLGNCKNIGKFRVQMNPQLKSLKGLPKLESIWNGLWVKNCHQLHTLGDFPELKRIMGTGWVVDSNQSILSLGNFPLLDTIADNVSIRYNNKLTDLGQLPQLKYISAKLSIWNNDSLKTLSGWPSLSQVKNSISIMQNNNLVEITGFNALTRMGGLRVDSNQKLSSINAFNQVQTQTDLDGIRILNNPALQELTICRAMTSSIIIEINHNDYLERILGFDLLIENTRSLSISNNKVLHSIQAFSALTKSGDFRIENNPELTEIIGLDELKEIRQTSSTINSYSGYFYIVSNPKLALFTSMAKLQSVYLDIMLSGNDFSQCTLQLTALTATGSLSIINNKNLYSIIGNQALNCPVTIRNNAALHHIQQIGANTKLIIDNNPELVTIDAFHNSIALNEIAIKNNPKLQVFHGFSQLQNTDRIEFIGLPLLAQIPPIGDTSISFITIRGCHTIHHLDCFNNLRHCVQFVVDSCMALQNLSGLANFRTNASATPWLSNSLFSISNCGLTELSGLQNATNLQNLTIQANPNLVTIGQLPKLTRITGTLKIINNPLLTQINTSDSLRTIEGNWEFKDNPNFRDLSGLSRLKQVWGTWTIDNTGLHDFSSLDSIDYAGQLIIKNNRRMTTLTGLEKMSVTKILKLESNDSLRDISGLGYMRVQQGITITGNPQLHECRVFPVCDKILTNSQSLFIANNGASCSDVPSVAFQCQNLLSVVGGKVYLDRNCNQTFDSSEDVPYANKMVINQVTGAPIAHTQPDGSYAFAKPPASTISFMPKIDGAYFISVPAERTMPATNLPMALPGADFAVCLDSSYHDLEVFATSWGPVRPGFTFDLRVCIRNNGPWHEENVSLNLDFDNTNFQHLTILDNAGAIVNQDILTWVIGTLNPFETRCFTLRIKLSTAIVPGQRILASLICKYDRENLDVTLDNNSIRWQREVVASYDPNDKTADRHTLPYQGPQDRSVLDYVVRFQNTGTAPAIFVEVYDTISQKLDLRTLEMVDASHAYSLSFPAENVLKWRFDNINLPDSASNPLGSQGFVRFRIAAHEGLPLYDQVKNAVSIYFDYNTPVLTDTALATVCPDMNLSTLAVPTKCGKNNGIAVVSHAPGNFTYLWSNGSTISKISGLAPGLYTVTVFSSLPACHETAVVEIQEIPAPQLELTDIEHVRCYGQANGRVEVSSPTGLPPFTYLWNTGDTTGYLDGLAPGTYSVILKDKNNCRDTLEQITITQPDSLAISAQVLQQTSLQNPDGSISVFTQGGTAPYAITWSNGDTSAQLTNLAANTYTVTVTDAQGCTLSAVFEVQYIVGVTTALKLTPIVQPNPTDTYLRIQMRETPRCSGNIRIQLLNELGTSCLEKWIESDISVTELQVHTLPAGAYRLVVSCPQAGASSETQVIIQR